MTQENVNQFVDTLDNLIDKALSEYKDEVYELNKENDRDYKIRQIKSLHENYSRKSVEYIDSNFPIENDSTYVANNYARMFLYKYSTKRNSEFSAVKNSFLHSLGN